ncbi:uncharacterized protein LOC113315458 [Papaver somniferum]|uniref:uncharacterized protein LOC113315458 n=1 Tax=Papaver somniferum TaxID=3469 RepID=UPI000E702B31|nr:uncharacterized protein LOC113315458 [Papaver somniferum]
MGDDADEPPTVEKLIEVQIRDEKQKTTFVGADLPAHERDGLITLLRANADVFAWSFAEMPGIDPNVACHRLNIDEKFHPVRQKIRNMAQIKKIWSCCRNREAVGSRIYSTGETYQHLVDHMFKDLIGKMMEVYIDDMVVKSKQKESHFIDIQKMFDILRRYRMKLNPTKCSFGLSLKKFLGYLMTHRGIEVNPEQIRAIREMSSPRTKKEVPQLAGRLTSLNLFMSRSSDRFKPFFDVLKKAVHFGWADECEKVYDEIKQYFPTPPVLHVFFVSKYLMGEETRYIKIKKIALALLHASHRLKPYFQGRQIVVYSEYTLKRVLERADDSNRLAIWSNFLGAYGIKYETRNAEKGHALAALLADSPVDDIETVTEEEELLAGVGYVILTPEGSRIEKATRFGFRASNNEAGYEKAIIGLKAVKQLEAKNVKLRTDSMLVVNHFLGTYRAKEERMALYLDHMRELVNEFDQFSIGQRPQLENSHADTLAYQFSAVDTDTTCFVLVDFQELPSISENHFVLALEHASEGEWVTTSAQEDIENTDSNMDVDSPVIDDSDNPAENVSDWCQPYIRYLTTSELPEDEKLASKVKNNAWIYSMIEGQLYHKHVALEPFLRCVSAEEG